LPADVADAAGVPVVLSHALCGLRARRSGHGPGLVLTALELAVWTRQQHRLDGLVHHNDASGQYLAIRYTDTLTAAGAVASVGRSTTPSPSLRSANSRPN
jgi:putative transposase